MFVATSGGRSLAQPGADRQAGADPVVAARWWTIAPVPSRGPKWLPGRTKPTRPRQRHHALRLL